MRLAGALSVNKYCSPTVTERGLVTKTWFIHQVNGWEPSMVTRQAWGGASTAHQDPRGHSCSAAQEKAEAKG